MEDEVYFIHEEDSHGSLQLSSNLINSNTNFDDFRKTNKFLHFKLQALDKRDKIKIAKEAKERFLYDRRENFKLRIKEREERSILLKAVNVKSVSNSYIGSAVLPIYLEGIAEKFRLRKAILAKNSTLGKVSQK